MEKSIYKYPVTFDYKNNGIILKANVKIPKNSKVISGFVQRDQAYIYAIVNTKEEEFIDREVLWLGTGCPIDKELEWKIEHFDFLCTCRDENYVWHLWIEPEYEVIDFE